MKISTEDKIQQTAICVLSIKETITIMRLFADHLENIRRFEYLGNATYDDYIKGDSLYAISEKWNDSELDTLRIMLNNSLSLITKYSTIVDFKNDIDRWCKSSDKEDWGCNECECIDYEIATKILSELNTNKIEFYVNFDNRLDDLETIKKIEKLGTDLRRENIKDFTLPTQELFDVFRANINNENNENNETLNTNNINKEIIK